MILTGVDNKYGITDGYEWYNWHYLRPEEGGIAVNSLNQYKNLLGKKPQCAYYKRYSVALVVYKGRYIKRKYNYI